MASRAGEGVPGMPASARVPLLNNGDRLVRPEFERRFRAMPHLKKAELIDGVVYMPAPVSCLNHTAPLLNLIAWMGEYCVATPGVRGTEKSSIRLDLDNEPQPDALLLVLPTHGGQIRVDEEGYIAGAPELTAEVAASSVSYDLHDKLHVYRRNGVREYIVWRVLDQAINWFVHREGRYEPLTPGEDGIYRSEVFPGLWLDPAALIRGDLATVMQTLQQGIASPEHADLIARLQQHAEQGA